MDKVKLSTLRQIRGGARSFSDAKLVELQRQAAQSIGIKEVARLRGLVLEQTQVIKELQLLQAHIQQLDNDIGGMVEHAREGHMLLSFPGIGPIMAATSIAAIGSIHHFPSAAALKSYVGWAPVVAQSGSTVDHTRLTHGGTRTMKHMLFLAVFQAIRLKDNEWAKLSERLVTTTCPFDERTQSSLGKTRVIGRVAGQMTEAIYALLKRDAELLSRIPPGQDPPPPLLSDPEVHRQHHLGHYRPLKSTPPPHTITLLHPFPAQ